MSGRRFDLARWGLKEWAMTALSLIVLAAAMTLAGQGLASGAARHVVGLRFGGDAERTRIVVDLESGARGAVIEDGASGRIEVSLDGVSAGRVLSGQGSGLVRSYRMSGSRLALDLASSARIERRFLLPPGDGVENHRYVIDLVSTAQNGAQNGAASRNPRTIEAVMRQEAGAARAPARKPIIVVDPGHGGRDPGALGARTTESAINLAAAQALKTELERTGRYQVRMTRESDVYIDLQRRVQIARQAGADLFISLQADAGADPSTRGASVYTLSEQGAGRAVREFTRGDNWHRELRLPGRDPSVDRILLDMTQRVTQNRSAQFARLLLSGIEQASHPMLRRSHRDAGLAVLLAPDVPAVLLEMGFITNPDDERLLMDERQRRRLMRVVAEGIDAYFREPAAPFQIAGDIAG
jgi:N-acetylmuramoyl-L-alanine amidase